MLDDWGTDLDGNNLIMLDDSRTDLDSKIENCDIKTETIIEETQRESIINRPHNLAGSVKRVFKDRYSISETKAEYKESSTVPALMKLFMESLDNPIDIAIKGGCDKINIFVDEISISIEDNGYGISSDKDENGEYILYKAMCKYNTSSNYQENSGKGQKGVNGIGIKLCSTLSSKFEATTDDGRKIIHLIATENNLNHKITEHKTTKKTGLKLRFEPDFNIFEVDKIDSDHIERMYEYTLIQSLTYPNIKFTFNGKKIKYNYKQFIKLFGSDYVFDYNDDYFFAFFPNDSDEFKQISFVNGLETCKGGTHIDFISNSIVNLIRNKLIKKFKTLKPADIKNKLLCIIIAKNVKDISWDGQTKESITSPVSIMRDYFDKSNLQKIANEILKNKAFIDPITEIYRIKAEFKRRQDMKALDKPKKKIKSEKYTPAIGKNKILFITEGESALGGIMPVLGRQGNGFYALKGVPLNTIIADRDKFLKNVELSELYTIIKNEGYEKIVFGNDADSDGDHIVGLLLGFCQKYFPDKLNSIGCLRTPIKAIRKNNKVIRWTYNLTEELTPKSGEQFKYYKGLGSWSTKDLKIVIAKDSLDNMIRMFDFEDGTIIEKWLGKSPEYRKTEIMNNSFDITNS